MKKGDAREVADALLSRSICSVQCAAVLVDHWGIHAWSWNHIGFNGMGEHAEMGCLRRANWRRLAGSTIYVAARRTRNLKMVPARPCDDCGGSLRHQGVRMVWRDSDGSWKTS